MCIRFLREKESNMQKMLLNAQNGEKWPILADIPKSQKFLVVFVSSASASDCAEQSLSI